MGKKIGLINCSGACYPAILARSACNLVAIRNNDKFSEICFTEHAASLLSGRIESIEKSQRFLENYPSIISISGCGASCATKLLNMYGINPRKIHISEDVNIESKTPPFTIEEINKLNDHLNEAIDLIIETSESLKKAA